MDMSELTQKTPPPKDDESTATESDSDTEIEEEAEPAKVSMDPSQGSEVVFRKIDSRPPPSQHGHSDSDTGEATDQEMEVQGTGGARPNEGLGFGQGVGGGPLMSTPRRMDAPPMTLGRKATPIPQVEQTMMGFQAPPPSSFHQLPPRRSASPRAHRVSPPLPPKEPVRPATMTRGQMTTPPIRTSSPRFPSHPMGTQQTQAASLPPLRGQTQQAGGSYDQFRPGARNITNVAEAFLDRYDSHSEKLHSTEQFLMSQIAAVRADTAQGIKLQIDQSRKEFKHDLADTRENLNHSISAMHEHMKVLREDMRLGLAKNQRELKQGLEENNRDMGTLINTVESLKELVVTSCGGSQAARGSREDRLGREERAASRREIDPEAAAGRGNRSQWGRFAMAQRGSGRFAHESAQEPADLGARAQPPVVHRDSCWPGEGSRGYQLDTKERYSMQAQPGSQMSPQMEGRGASEAASRPYDPLSEMARPPAATQPQYYDTQFHEPAPSPYYPNFMHNVMPNEGIAPAQSQTAVKYEQEQKHEQMLLEKKAERSRRKEKSQRRRHSSSSHSSTDRSDSDASGGTSDSGESRSRSRSKKRSNKAKKPNREESSDSSDDDSSYDDDSSDGYDTPPSRKPRGHKKKKARKGRYPRRSDKGHYRSRRGYNRGRNMTCPVYKEGEDWSDFLVQYQLFSRECRLRGSQKASYLVSALRGSAKSCLSLLGKKGAQNYKKLVTTLTRLYSPEGSTARHGCTLMTRVYKGFRAETLPHYLQVLRKLYFKAYGNHVASDRVIKDLFIKGLDSRSLRTLVSVQRPATSQEALDIALSIQSQTDEGAKAKTGKEDGIHALTEGSSSPKPKGKKNKGRKGKGRRRRAKDTDVDTDFEPDPVGAAQTEPTGEANGNPAMQQMLSCMQQVSENMSALQKRFQRKPMSELSCYQCGATGHVRSLCPDNPNRRPQPAQGPQAYGHPDGHKPRQGYQVRFDAPKPEAPAPPRWFSNDAPYPKANAVSAVDDMLGLEQLESDHLNE